MNEQTKTRKASEDGVDHDCPRHHCRSRTGGNWRRTRSSAYDQGSRSAVLRRRRHARVLARGHGIGAAVLRSGGAVAAVWVYQAQWRFSAITLTEVFAVYALFLLVTLLVFGSVADYLGRRRVILAGLVITAGACGLFLAAHGVGLLFAARALHGAAVGTSVSALGAALIDLQPEGRRLAPVVTSAASILGLAAGGLAASALVQYGPAPTIWCGGYCSA